MMPATRSRPTSRPGSGRTMRQSLGPPNAGKVYPARGAVPAGGAKKHPVVTLSALGGASAGELHAGSERVDCVQRGVQGADIDAVLAPGAGPADRRVLGDQGVE